MQYSIINKGVVTCLLIFHIGLLGCNNTNASKANKTSKTPAVRIIQSETLSPIDYNIYFDNKIIDGTPVVPFEIGMVKLPTGKIVVCDPIVWENFIPFNKVVNPGRYPVIVYIAKTKESGDRNAIAKLQFSAKRADKWVLALRDGDDTSGLKDSLDYFGFPVDSGLGSFLDYNTGVNYQKFQDQFYKNNPNGNIYTEVFEKEFQMLVKHSNNVNSRGDWINYKIPNSDLNIIMLTSGYGDGVYPAYWGMTKDNEIVSLVIDFFVLLSQDR